MKTMISGVFWVIIALLFSTGVEAQQQLNQQKENVKPVKGFQKVLQRSQTVPTRSSAKYKTGFDKGISSIELQYYSESEWLTYSRKDLSYNEDRTIITETVFGHNGESFEKVSTNTITLNENGLFERYQTMDIDGEFTFDQRIFYNQEYTFIDSVIMLESYSDEYYLDKVNFITHSSDSIEIVQYSNYNGEEETIYGDYILVRDGNYIEHYIYDDFIDRYTYYNITIIELLDLAYSEIPFFEMYNDEYYPETEEWVPYERQTLSKDGDKVVEILIEGWYDTDWEDEERYLIDYDGELILSSTYEYTSGNSFEPEIRSLFTYESATSQELQNDLPRKVTLSQNYPNPFNPSTNIAFELSESGVTRLAVYDMLGRKVADLINGMHEAGVHQVSFSASGLSSGLYYYVLEQPEFGIKMTRSMTLIK